MAIYTPRKEHVLEGREWMLPPFLDGNNAAILTGRLSRRERRIEIGAMLFVFGCSNGAVPEKFYYVSFNVSFNVSSTDNYRFGLLLASLFFLSHARAEQQIIDRTSRLRWVLFP